MTTEPRLTDYRTHYRLDADLIEDPADLHPVRSSSERRRLETIRRALRLRPGELLLDLGCGSGWLAQLSHEAGVHVVATDAVVLVAEVGASRMDEQDFEFAFPRRLRRRRPAKEKNAGATADHRFPSAD